MIISSNLKNEKIINFLIISLVAILVLTLFLGYQCKYIKPSFCSFSFIKNFLAESGFVENLQSLLLFISIIILLFSFNKFKKHKIIKLFLIIKIFALTYYLGEEISWGQHFFKWSTSELFNKINNQKETNLHNISNLLDQLPRTLVILWCSLIPIFFYFFKKKYTSSKLITLIILPHKKLLFLSAIFLFFFLPDFFVDKLNLHPGHHIDGKDIMESIYFDNFTFNYLERLSEIHELIFCYYFLIYCISFQSNNNIEKQGSFYTFK